MVDFKVGSPVEQTLSGKYKFNTSAPLAFVQNPKVNMAALLNQYHDRALEEVSGKPVVNSADALAVKLAQESGVSRANWNENTVVENKEPPKTPPKGTYIG